MSGGVLLMMVFLKKHRSHTHRLIMYLNIGIMIQGLISTLGFNSIIAGNDLSLYYSNYCSVLGFLNNYAIFVQLVLIGWIMIDVFLKTALDLYTKTAFEVIQVCSAFLGPLLFLWIPLVPAIKAYGGQGALCDIKILNYNNCTQHKAGFVVSTVVCVVQIVALVVSVILYAITISRLNVQQKESKSESVCQSHIKHEIDKLRKRTHKLVFFPVIFFIFSLPGWIEVYLQYSIQEYVPAFQMLLIIQIICLNLRGIVISVTFCFTTDICTRMWELSPRHMRLKCCRKKSSLSPQVQGFQSPYVLEPNKAATYKVTDSYMRGPKLQQVNHV